MKNQGFWTVFGGIFTGLGLLMLINYGVSLSYERSLSVLYMIVGTICFGTGLCITTSLVISFNQKHDLSERYAEITYSPNNISLDGFVIYDEEEDVILSLHMIKLFIIRCLRMASGMNREAAHLQVKGMPEERLTDEYLITKGFVIEVPSKDQFSDEKFRRLVVRLVRRDVVQGLIVTGWAVEGNPELTRYLFKMIVQ